MKKILIIFFVVFLIILFILFWNNRQYPDNLSIIIADTPTERVKGLSGRKSLAENQIMLFIFDYPDYYKIWMEDMKFPIDIIWLDENKKITHVEENISPETFPETFFPPEKSLYIIEANAGFARKNDLQVGNVFTTPLF